ncbi:Velvet domain-containing protein [Mycena sanguinolenta]|uniref:Velvet domain-containing protein n=1 Tax=Mycena sanguinolenta TaxID=230812 RepID=A0A8H6ZHX0_9AGAR|nr:Velvet domain-containing protein [Mycena sanguinolenta]
MESSGAHLKYDVKIRQQPLHARISAMKISADRRPVDPPMIVQLSVTDPRNIGVSTSPPSRAPTQASHLHLTNPYYFMYAALIEPHTDNEVKYVCDGGSPSTSGALVSSVRVLKDYPNSDQDAAFFIFPNICVRLEGSWRFKLTLFVIDGDKVKLCATTCSDPFFVYQGKQYPGVQASTPLTRALAAQGVKLRIRQEIRQKNSVRAKEEEDFAALQEAEENTSSTSSPDSSLSRSPPKRRRTLTSPIDSLHSFDSPPPADDAVHLPRQHSSYSSLFAPEKVTDARRTSLDAQIGHRPYNTSREWLSTRILDEYNLSPQFNFVSKPESSDDYVHWGLMRSHPSAENNHGLLHRQASTPDSAERCANTYSWSRDFFAHSPSTTHSEHDTQEQFSPTTPTFWQMNISSSPRAGFEQHAQRPGWPQRVAYRTT